jgi:hypothetical protein
VIGGRRDTSADRMGALRCVGEAWELEGGGSAKLIAGVFGWLGRRMGSVVDCEVRRRFDDCVAWRGRSETPIFGKWKSKP